LPSETPINASEMYAKNLFNLLSPMIKEGELHIDWEDEVIAGCALTHAGEIKHGPTRQLVEQG
jgi:NAD(P) transhydrogenase subunit alpha